MNEEFLALLSLFRSESQDILDELAERLAALASQQDRPNEEELRHCMRLAHNVKGAAAVVDWQSLVQLSHALEDVIRTLGDADSLERSSRVELLLEAITFMQRHAAEGSPEPSAAPAEASFLVERLRFETSRSVPDSSIATGTVEQRTVASTNKAPVEPLETEDTTSRAVGPLAASTLRVETRRIDDLMGLTREILLAQGRMNAFGSALAEALEELRSVAQETKNYNDGSPLWRCVEKFGLLARDHLRDRADFGYLAAGVSEAIRKLRMVRIESYGHAFRRAVRETALTLDKQVELILAVGDLELDKAVLERLVEPIVHLLRNAVDHGLEPTLQRQALHKPAVGRIRLSAHAEGARMNLILEDDGKGIDIEKVRAVAVERGLLAVGEEASDDVVLGVLTRSGFSTARQVTSVSGRGVGLDVVESALSGLGGQLKIVPRGELGGAAFRISVPVSLLTTQALLVRDGQRIVALPLDVVDRTTRVEMSSLVRQGDRVILTGANEEPILVRTLGSIFFSQGMPDRGTRQVVVLQRHGRKLGLAVDEVLRHEDFVVGPLPSIVSNLPGATGVIALPDGALALVLDVGELMKRAESGGRVSEPSALRKSRVLVVDDSLTARTLSRNILAAAGYEVVTASDGEEAWELLAEGGFELVVSDVQMPRLDGLGLTRRIREHPKTARLPVVLISTLASEKDKEAAKAAGADDYVVKGAYEQEKLLAAATRYL